MNTEYAESCEGCHHTQSLALKATIPLTEKILKAFYPFTAIQNVIMLPHSLKFRYLATLSILDLAKKQIYRKTDTTKFMYSTQGIPLAISHSLAMLFMCSQFY